MALLPDKARIAQLVSVLDVRQPAHEVAVCHLSQPMKVLVPETRMPMSSVGDMAHDEAHGVERAKRMLVEAIWCSGYPDKQSATLVTHGEHPTANHDVVPALVGLADPHDAALERQDEEDICAFGCLPPSRQRTAPSRRSSGQAPRMC